MRRFIFFLIFQVVFTLALVAVEVLVIVVWFISSPPKVILEIASVEIPPEVNTLILLSKSVNEKLSNF